MSVLLTRFGLCVVVQWVFLSTPSNGRSDCNEKNLTSLITVAEGTRPGKVLLTLTPQNWSWTISNQKPFNVMKLNKTKTGYSIVLSGILDKETEDKFTFTLQCKGTKWSMILFVKDINDNCPIFQKAPYKVSLSESTKIDTVILDLKGKVTDADKSGNKVILDIANQSAPFKMEDSRVKLTKTLDYDEGPKIYHVTITATDTGKPPCVKTANLTVTVKDYDDLNPKFDQRIYNVSIFENQNDTNISIHATDQDLGINQEVNYRFINGKPDSFQSVFKIDASTGHLQLKKELDRELVSEYLVLIQAFQTDKPWSRFDTTLLIVSVKDKNDNHPKMDKKSYKATIKENTPNASKILQVSATDNDTGKNAEFEFRMEHKNSNPFKVDHLSGWITVEDSSLLDYETKPKFILNVFAVETQAALKHKSTAAVTIELLDVNDNSPTFNKTRYIFTVDKSKCNGIVGKVSAYDLDHGKNGEFHFDLVVSANESFSLDSLGNIHLQKCLKTHYQPRYYLAVKAEDKGIPSRLALVEVEIVVNYKNLSPPKFTEQNVGVKISEAAPIGTIVAQLVATDPDFEDHLTFSIKKSHPYFNLSSNPGSCIILTKKLLDREKTASYLLTVEVNDGNFSDSARVNVTVLDVNDNSPVFTQKSYAFNVKENQTANIFVGNVTATDKDEKSELKYSIIDSSYFQINSQTGIITTKAPLDREKMSKVEFVIRANDTGIPSRNGAARVIVSIQDVNDNAPQFLDDTILFSIPEGRCGIIYVASAIDADEEIKNKKTEFYISVNNMFDMASNGSLTLKCGNPTKNLRGQNVSVEVFAYNTKKYDVKSVQNHSQSVFVVFKDINNNIPKFNVTKYRFNMEENTASGTVIGSVYAYDNDNNPRYKTVQYSIKGWNEDSYFYVEPSSGRIRVQRQSDFDPPNNNRIFNFTVRATNTVPVVDVGNAMNYSSVSVTVTVADVNDNPPEFSKDFYHQEIPENKRNGTLVMKVSAVDKDTGTYSKFTYHIVQSKLPFYILPDGKIHLNGRIDYDKGPRNYSFDIRAVDGNNHNMNSTAAVNIVVLNINDNKPVFKNRSYKFNLAENRPPGSIFGQVEASDLDGDNLRYHIHSKSSDFAVDQHSGILTSNKVFDFDTMKNKNKVITFEVDVNDSKHTAHSTVHLKILDENDNSPVFVYKNYTAKINETAQKGQDVIKVLATDKDTGLFGKVTYHIIDNFDGLFAINSSSGQISVGSKVKKTPFDVTFQSHVTLIIEARDGGHIPHIGTAVVDISVVDVNNQPPKFEQRNYFGSVYENQPNGTSVIKMTVTDEDTSWKDLNFNIMESKVDFQYNKACRCILTSRSLDRERTDNYTLNITVFDGVHYDFAFLHITVKDENDNYPVFIKTPYVTSINDNTVVGTEIYTVVATDKDVNSGFTYWLSESDGKFTISFSNGSVKVAGDLNHKFKSSYKLKVFASDHGSPPKISICILTININDSNFYFPKFTTKDMFKKVPENALKGHSIFTIQASDKDQGDAGIVIYNILNGDDDGVFLLNASSGVLTVNNSQKLDFEKIQNYTLLVEATDKGIDPKSATVTLTIMVTDVNDNAPSFKQLSFVRPLPVKGGSTIFILTATDKDGTSPNNKVRYNQTKPSSNFSVDANGAVKATKDLVMGSYTLNVTACDEATRHQLCSDNTLISIILDSLVPLFNPSVLYARVKENQSNAFVADVNTTKGDREMKYFILNGDGAKFFQVNHDTGVVRTKGVIDRENLLSDNITLVVSAHETNGNESQLQVFVSVEDVNDCAPTFSKSNYSVHVKEDEPKQYVVFTMTATDKDINPQLQYNMTSDGKQDNFELNHQGKITLTRQLDYESVRIYNLTLKVTDGKYFTVSQLQVNVIDVNDNVPTFNSSSYSASVEEELINENVIQVQANDKDELDDGKLTYSIVQGSENYFGISKSGVIFTRTAIDREKISNFTLTVFATDTGGNNSSSSVLITVTDVNDNSPVFTSLVYRGQVNGTADNNSLILIYPSISATDVDQGENGTSGIVFNLRGNKSNFFQMNKHEVRVSDTGCQKMNKEINDAFQITIIAKDRKGRGRSSSALLIITLLHVDELTPFFLQSHYSFEIFENAAFNQDVGKVLVVDNDIGGNASVRYSLVNSTYPFYIETQSGMIRVAGKLDRETTEWYVINVSAQDPAGHKALASVNVTIKDVNDNCPKFSSSKIILHVVEEMAAPLLVGQISANDPDFGANGDIVLFLNTTDSLTNFQLDANGSLRTRMRLDRENISSYYFPVFAQDKAAHPCLSSAMVQVLVDDINDHSPQFYSDNKTVSQYNVSIIEKSPENTVVAWVNAQDADQGENGTVAYKLNGTFKDYFRIDANGLVWLCMSVDFNILDYLLNSSGNTKLVLGVIAQDGSSVPRESLAKMFVTVNKISDHAPVFTKFLYQFDVHENIKPPYTLGTVKAVINNGKNISITMSYCLIQHMDAATHFSVEKTSGEIKTTVQLDREDRAFYSFPVKVVDGKIPERTAFTIINVNVTDENDNQPRFSKSSFAFGMMENSKHSFTINASDPDLGSGGIITYLLQAGHDTASADFTFNNTTGLLEIKSLDREKAAVFFVTITAMDQGQPPLNSTANVTITVKDENDNAPIFTQQLYNISIPENHKLQKVIQVNATDDDSGLNGMVLYRFINESGPFIVDHVSGVISTVWSIDYENNPFYKFTIMAYDLGQPTKSSFATLLINVLNVCDDVPNFNPKSKYIWMTTEDAAGKAVMTVNAGSSNFFYNTTEQEYFAIDPNTGSVTLKKSLDRTAKHVINISAWSLCQPQKVDTFTIMVYVKDDNPKFDRRTKELKIPEGKKPPFLLTDITTEDETRGRPIVYSLVNTSDIFYINSTNGKLYCNKSLDREASSVYFIYVKADLSTKRVKRGFGDKSNELIIKIVVMDTNDHAPSFLTATIYFVIPKTARQNSLVAKLKAIDKDEGENSKLKYEITGGDESFFYIDASTGEVRLQKDISKSVRKAFTLYVKATDQFGAGKSTNVTVQLLVVSRNRYFVITDNLSIGEFRKVQAQIIGNLSRILGLQINIDAVEPHIKETSSGNVIDLERTDLYFHAIDRKTGTIVPGDRLKALMNAKSEEIRALFKAFHIQKVQQIPVKHDKYKLSVAEICLIALSAVLFVACILAVLLICCSWKRRKEEQVRNEMAKNARDTSLNTFFSNRYESENMESSVASLGFSDADIYDSYTNGNVMRIDDDGGWMTDESVLNPLKNDILHRVTSNPENLLKSATIASVTDPDLLSESNSNDDKLLSDSEQISNFRCSQAMVENKSDALEKAADPNVTNVDLKDETQVDSAIGTSFIEKSPQDHSSLILPYLKEDSLSKGFLILSDQDEDVITSL